MTTIDMFDFGGNFKIWISIIVGMKQEKNFNAVTVMGIFLNHLKFRVVVGMEILLRVIFLF